MRVVQRSERGHRDHEVVDLVAYERRAAERGDHWSTVLAFVIAGALAIALILGVWAASPSPGL
jgi:Ni/Co efflux regulator RcnB